MEATASGSRVPERELFDEVAGVVGGVLSSTSAFHFVDTLRRHEGLDLSHGTPRALSNKSAAARGLPAEMTHRQDIQPVLIPRLWRSLELLDLRDVDIKAEFVSVGETDSSVDVDGEIASFDGATVAIVDGIMLSARP